jgi:tetratricopeptide (TPR) repeat protein
VLDRADHELDNARTALAWADERSEARVLNEVAGGLRMHWHLRGLYREGRRWSELAYARPSDDDLLRIWVLDGLSSIAYRQGDYDRALEVAEEAMPLARASGSDAEISTAVTNLANALAALGRVEEAIVLYDEALEVSRRLDVPARVATAVINRGDMANIVGRYEEAIGFLQRGLGYAREQQLRGGVTVALLNLATSTFMLGRDDEAESYARQSAEDPDITDIETMALLILAGIANRRGDRIGAARLVGASESLRDATGYELEPGEHAVVATVRAEMGNLGDDPSVEAAYREGRALEPDAAKALI